MAKARGTSFSAVSAPHASRNEAPSTATPETVTVGTAPISVPVTTTATQPTVSANAAPT
jgi:hypothetical protein